MRLNENSTGEDRRDNLARGGCVARSVGLREEERQPGDGAQARADVSGSCGNDDAAGR